MMGQSFWLWPHDLTAVDDRYLKPRWQPEKGRCKVRKERALKRKRCLWLVHIFDLEGNPKANRAYAWSAPIEGSDKRRFFAVLHVWPVTSPVEAVRAAIVAEHREGNR